MAAEFSPPDETPESSVSNLPGRSTDALGTNPISTAFAWLGSLPRTVGDVPRRLGDSFLQIREDTFEHPGKNLALTALLALELIVEARVAPPQDPDQQIWHELNRLEEQAMRKAGHTRPGE